MTSKKISILLSCYNADELIKDYIDALMRLDSYNWTTLVAINFAFSHSDPAYVEKQLRRYKDLVLINKSCNISVYDAWNQAARLATTDYVANLNLDDRVTQFYYTNALEALEAYSGDVYSSRAISTPVVGQECDDSRLQPHIQDEAFGDSDIITYSLRDLVAFKNGRLVKNSIPHCAPVWRRELHDSYGYFSSRKFDFCADYEFWLRLAADGRRFLLNKSVETIFYCAPGTASDRLMHQESSSILEFWKKTFPPSTYRETHLGRDHDYLHHCFNYNAILSDIRYYSHIKEEVSTLPGSDSFEISKLKELHSRLHIHGKLNFLDERDEYQRLKEFKNCLLGKSAILVCNGPSLREVDFGLIDESRYTIMGLNKIYLGFENLSISPRFIAAVNKKVLEQSATDYNALGITKFISNRVDAALLPSDETTYRINSQHLPKGAKRFSLEPDSYIHEGWTVTHVALQLLYYMGISKVFIVGMDHNFNQHEVGKENKAAVIEGDDIDHFDPRYFGNGQQWDLPDLVNSEISYQEALKTYQSDGRSIYDCTVNGKCKVFPKLPISFLYSTSAEQPISEGPEFLGSTGNRWIPQVSVICPFKDSEKYFEVAIRSVLDQKDITLELLLVDDGSLDASLTIAKKWSEVDVRVRVFSNQRKPGVSGARNTGLDKAVGKYIAFLDADDYYNDGDALRRRVNKLEERNVDLVHSTTQMILCSGEATEIVIGKCKDLDFYDTYTNPVHLNGICGSREVMLSSRFDESLSNGEDWLYFASLLRKGAVSRFVDAAGAVYRIHGSSTVALNVEGHHSGIKYVLDWLYSRDTDIQIASECVEPICKPEKNEILYQREASLLVSLILNGQSEKARHLLDNNGLTDFLNKKEPGELNNILKVPCLRAFLLTPERLDELNATEKLNIATAITKSSLEANVPTFADILSNKLKSKPHSSGKHVNLLGPYSRDTKARWDETEGVSILADAIFNRPGVMVDVGAHQGTALAPFLEKGWKVYAFEPDIQNRTKLVQFLRQHRFGNTVTLDRRCVGNKIENNVPFFTSEQSTGISGLSAFHSTHIESQVVDVTTLSDFFAPEDTPEIHFLKIDTEGHDLFVLEGYPWDRNKPLIIECEFEDSKTLPLGYDYHKLATFLLEKGYNVYVSEWHPIIRYGIRHDWCQLTRYPAELADPKGWGNLIAFREQVDENLIVNSIRSLIENIDVVNDKNTIDSGKSRFAHKFRFECTSAFRLVSTDQWIFDSSQSGDKLWIAVFDLNSRTQNRSFVGHIRLSSNKRMKVAFSVARHGRTKYESSITLVDLMPDVPQTIILSKEFTLDHDALKLQIEPREYSDSEDAVLTIDQLGFAESLSSIRKRIDADEFGLSDANLLFRKGDYISALSMYLILCKERPLTFYEWNIVRSAAKLGMSWTKTVSDLSWLSSTCG